MVRRVSYRYAGLRTRHRNEHVILEMSADIGGSAVPNDMPQGLSDITLRWMLREIVKSQCGILFNDDALREAGIVLVMDDSAIKDQDSEDALRPLHDGLKQWWILEVLPMKFMWQDLSGKWMTRIR